MDVNDGSAQRSMVSSLTVKFGGVVSLGEGAFEVVRGGNGPIGVQVESSVVDGRTIVVLTFTGVDVIGGSLTDGNYTLTIRADRVHDALGRELDGDGDGSAGGDRVDAFFRVFGDSDGDRDVDGADLDRFQAAIRSRRGMVNYVSFLDFDGNGFIDSLDQTQFYRRFGSALNP